MALKINIHDIRERKSAQITDTLVIQARELELPELEGVGWQQFSFDYTLTNAGNLFILQGKLEGQLSLECSRCLKPIDHRLCAEVLEQFSRSPQEDVYTYSGEEIDVAGALRENILLNLPVKSLCSPDCLGLCPHCGIDKNQQTCNCNPKPVDPRLAVLEKLIRK